MSWFVSGFVVGVALAVMVDSIEITNWAVN